MPAARCVTLIALAGICFPLQAADDIKPEDLEFFEKQVRPVLVANCFKCHSAGEKVKGGLLLDSRAGLLAGGDSGAAIEPGKPEESRLIEAIGYEDVLLKMPPKGKLKDDEIAALTKWVKLGAPWPDDKTAKPLVPASDPAEWTRRKAAWTWQPLKNAAPPKVKSKDWPADLLDQFVLAGLESHDLAPAKPADRATWLRRVTFALIGLPPTPDEITAFLADDAPKAHEKVVDRLLDSPHFGERWGRHWLDLVRYAETAGHEFDFDMPNAYMYRDYVVRAFNADVPYHQFVVEHLAGDLVAEPRRHPTEKYNESVIGTGFYWLGEGKHSPVDVREEEATQMDNQLDVLAKTFLGLTVSCARCHDHKFDAITQKDYYALAGFLRSSHYQEAFLDDPAPTRQLIADLQRNRDQRAALLRPGQIESRKQLAGNFAEYLLGAGELLPNRLSQIEIGDDLDEPDVVFADFEGETYVDWKAKGTAFGDRPNRGPIPAYQGDLAAVGKGFINTHSALVGDKREVGDPLTGTLTSSTFKIERKRITFLIGGGAHKDRTCLNLHVDGMVRRTATGQNNNRMAPAEFDVAEFVGQEAHFEIVDNEKGSWGNIGVDQIVFTNFGPGDRLRRQVAAVAERRQLDPVRLEKVRAACVAALPNSQHPLHAWAVLANQPDAAGRAAAWNGFLSDTSSPALNKDEVFESFDRADYRDWIVNGSAFGEQPLQKHDVIFANQRGEAPSVARLPGVAHSGAISHRLRGGLRSRTFTLEKNRVWLRLAGTGATVNLVIDEFHKIRYPIYGGLTLNINKPGAWDWYAIDVAMWKGHRAFVEILDDGDGWIAVDEITHTDGGAPTAVSSRPWIELLGDKPGDLEELALRHQTRMATALDEPAVKWGFWIMTDPLWTTDAAELTEAQRGTLAELTAEAAKIDAAFPVPRRALAMLDGTPENERLFIRGNHKNLGDEVPRRLLEVLGGAKKLAPEKRSGRLELAQQIVDPGNPLAARVFVNRVWHHLFGVGIVPTVDDFGAMGQPPSHPELLDHLALTFMNDGWSTKQLIRRIVLSQTYRMSSEVAPDQAERDPTNRWLHHFPVRRLEAETVRDAVLAVSGRLDRKLAGPSVLPYLTPFMLGRGRPGSGPLDGDGRRSLYINVRRNFLTPMFLAFDYPIPFTTIGRRSVSNVPAQALTLMNNPLVVQQAELWAKRTLAGPSRPRADRIRDMYLTAFGRAPSADELTSAEEFLETQGSAYGAPDHPQAWTDLAHVLFNVKEFIFIN